MRALHCLLAFGFVVLAASERIVVAQPVGQREPEAAIIEDAAPANGALAEVQARGLELERRVLEARKSLRSGQADVTYQSSPNDVRHWGMWFQGDKLRMEQTLSQRARPGIFVRADGKIYHRREGFKAGTGEVVRGAPEVHPDD